MKRIFAGDTGTQSPDLVTESIEQLRVLFSAAKVELLTLGLAPWHQKLAPSGESSMLLRDSVFADDVAKTNLTAIFQQYGLGNLRYL